MAKRSEPQSITIERNNRTYQGQYYVEGKMVHVTSLWGAKTTQVGGSSAESMARFLLREIVDQSGEEAC